MDSGVAFIDKLPFWDKLTVEEKKYIEKNVSLSKIQHGTTIYGVGDGPIGLALIVSGSVKGTTISDKGREIVLFRLGVGDVCILSHVKDCIFAYSTQLIAISDTVLLIINNKALEKLKLNNINVRSFVYEIVSQRLSKIVNVFQEIVFKSVEKRLIEYLLDEYNRSGSKIVRMTQEELAEEINSAREVVTRILKELIKNGYVEVPKRGELTLGNIEKLNDLLYT